MRLFAISGVLIFAATVLAGCADSSQDAGPIIDPSQLDTGKGAIAGLLVDDRFRPIQLVDDAKTEFQAEGFILLQETGQETRSNENGEFAFVNLDPGQYTIRVTATGHEAKPSKVSVVEAQFAEWTIEARRTSSEGSFTISEANSLFVPCVLHTIALSYQLPCVPDSSGDTNRGAYQRDWRGIEDLTWVVTELVFPNPPTAGEVYDATVRYDLETDYVSAILADGDGDWIKMHLLNGSVSPDPVPAGDYFYEWNNNESLQTAIFSRGVLAQEIQGAYSPVHEVINSTCGPPVPAVGCTYATAPMRRGAGLKAALQADALVTAYIGEPEVDPRELCGLCPA